MALTPLVPINLGNVAMTLLRSPFYADQFSPTLWTKQCLFFAGPDDNSCVWFTATTSGNPRRLDIFVVDISGAITWYSSLGLANGVGDISQIVPLGGGIFFVATETGYSFLFRAGNLKLNNSSPISILNSGTILSISCTGDEPVSYYYDGTRQLLSVAWYHVGISSGPIYANVYQVGPNIFEPIVSGYVGAYQVAPRYDPYDFTGGLAGQQTSNGQFIQLQNGIEYLLMNQTRINVNTPQKGGFSGCGTPCGVFITADIAAQQESNVFIGGNNNHLCDTTIPGLAGFTSSTNNNAFWFAGPGLFFEHGFTGIVNNSLIMVALTRKNIFAMCYQGGYGYIYGGIPAANQIPQSLPAVTRYKWGLSNYARPISLTGKYKA